MLTLQVWVAHVDPMFFLLIAELTDWFVVNVLLAMLSAQQIIIATLVQLWCKTA